MSKGAQTATTPRPHTGRQCNEAARLAILDATADLLTEGVGEDITIEQIAARARIGRQTIYRWWPSKSALMLEAVVARARMNVGPVDTGTVLGDLTSVLRATFARAHQPPVASLLRTTMREALSDPEALAGLRGFTAERRNELRAVLERGQRRGELAKDTDLDLAVDQAFGLL